MLRKIAAVAFVPGAVLVSTGSARAAGVNETVHRADFILRGRSFAAVAHVEVHTASYDRDYTMAVWEDDSHDKRGRVLVKILGPALFRGQGTLKVDGKMTVYNPSTDRLTVLGSSMLGEGWMGTHLTNDDLVKETDTDDYSARLVRKWSGTSADGAPAEHDLIELAALPRAQVVWPKMQFELYVENGHVIPVRKDFFKRAADASPARSMTFGVVKKVGERTIPTVVTLTTASHPDEYTKLTYETIRFDVPIPDSKFTEQALRAW
jgi:hypothetical protein